MTHEPVQIDSEVPRSVSDTFSGHSSVLHAVVARRVPADAVDDVLQEVAVALVRTSVPPADDDERCHWLCRVALTQCAVYWRKRSRRASQEQAGVDLDAQSKESPDPLLALLAQESELQIKDAFNSLDADARKLLKRKVVDKKTYQQVADEFSISRDAAEYRILAAKRSLRQAILQQGYLEDK